MDKAKWTHVIKIQTQSFTCGYCSREISTEDGWQGTQQIQDPGPGLHSHTVNLYTAICPRCGFPSFIIPGGAIPAPRFGDAVQYLPEDVEALYDEARDSVSRGNFTAASMVGRKLLVNVAVTKGAEAKKGKSFQDYLTDLLDRQVVTPDMEPWVDQIRKLGNIATHEITPTARDQAEDLVTFVGMLLKIVYEYPARHAQYVEPDTTG